MVKTAKVIESLLPPVKDVKKTDWRLKLDCNENIFGVSKYVINAIKNADEKELLLYPNTEKHTNKYCEKHNIKTEKVLFVDKKNYALNGIISTYIDENDEFISYNSELNLIENFVKCQKGVFKTIEYEKDFIFDKKSITGNITEQTKIIYISTPDIICGRLIKASEIEDIVKDYPEILFVVDCSYINYSKDLTMSDYTEIIDKYKNIIVLKSYSSDCALAGFDLSVIISSELIINELKKVISSDDVSSLFLMCSMTAENDTNKIEKDKELINKNKKLFIEGLTGAGYKPYESDANFIICDFFEYCDFYYQKFKNNGILVKKFEKKLPYSSCLRITVPTEGGVRYILELIKKKDVLVFNPDGIIFDINDSYISAVAKTVEVLTGVQISKERAIDTMNTCRLCSDIDLIDQITADMFFSPKAEDIIKTFKDILLSIDETTKKRYIDNTELLLPSEIIEELNKRYDLVLNVKHGIKGIEYLLEQFNIERFFNYISAADINRTIKQIPALSQKFVTCDMNDIIGVNISGVDIVGITSGKTDDENKAKINNFKHLGVKYILNDIKEIETFLKAVE